ncbi:hypothetical protein [Sediminispirochaeta bajacaliforniensis]|uniref:hypothetical protein n=1 Tax=Sediminispirochaeta bajacaliforniensis TaxID=148 RepID=UPI0012B67B0F|nr:hypothetical protein [Sediminispirochaeta bajacaliforniensis]
MEKSENVLFSVKIFTEEWNAEDNKELAGSIVSVKTTGPTKIPIFLAQLPQEELKPL